LVAESGYTFGMVWSCDEHKNDKGTAIFEVADDSECNVCGRPSFDCNEAGDCHTAAGYG
jgi:hypothetical protein